MGHDEYADRLSRLHIPSMTIGEIQREILSAAEVIRTLSSGSDALEAAARIEALEAEVERLPDAHVTYEHQPAKCLWGSTNGHVDCVPVAGEFGGEPMCEVHVDALGGEQNPMGILARLRAATGVQ
jgi:hypothetical protein